MKAYGYLHQKPRFTSAAEVVKGECVGGVQKLHYISPQGCIPRGGTTDTMTSTQHCSVIPRQLQIIIGIGVGLGVLLCALLVYFWKKNRRLEYKYMKLVASSSGKDGELPAAESCAIEEDEEDHFENGGYDPKNSKGLLQKFRTVRIGSGKAYLGSLAAMFHVIVLYAFFVSAEVIKRLEGDSSSLHGSIKHM
ncbi:hypothetical protein HPB48_009803 [Haemaphysalis longicornis]|uniref:Uncharacterized protein n=1 Tax=Haemaphysalis longicornis TaxID=44386 RepID=A0A9J6H2D4_HAELO|nr:hypothetical protein HPB48_009803 [Haemaphysalis longicornis]